MRFSFILIFLAFSTLTTFATESLKKEEILKGFVLDQKNLTFIVVSTGCTDKQSFDLQIEPSLMDITASYRPGIGFSKDEVPTLNLRLVRIKKDQCKAMPQDIEITFLKEEIKKLTEKENIKFSALMRILNPIFR